MSAAEVAMIALVAASALIGAWHGNRMYKLGRKHGAEWEAMLARHARERVIDDVKLQVFKARRRYIEGERMDDE